MNADRYARQRMIEWWDQDRLRKARVLVAGAGALGNEVLKNLVLLGIGHLLVIDFDRVEDSNLSRTVLFDEKDIGRPKVEAAAETLSRLNPEVTIQTINGDLFYEVGLGHYFHCDLAVGCLDNLAARSQVGRSCNLAGIPYLDGGVWSLGGEVRWFMGGDGSCFDCTLSEEDIERANDRHSCTGFRRMDWEENVPVSTMATTASIIGGFLGQEGVKWLCNYPIKGGMAIVYNGQSLQLHCTKLPRNPNCPSSHTPYRNVIELSASPDTLTARQLLSLARPDLEQVDYPHHMLGALATHAQDPASFLELGRDFLLYLQCPSCKQHQEVNQHWSRVPESERVCPSCVVLRHAEVIRTVDESSPYIDRTLSSLGVPAKEVVAVHTAGKLLLYELK